MDKFMKKLLKIVISFLGICILVILCYFFYLSVTYVRIPDRQQLDVFTPENVIETMSVNNSYTICSYNVGFGAYSDDYSFFMDGGKYSRAFSKEAVIQNITGAMATIKQYDPDIFLVQEADKDATRSYHVDQTNIIRDSFSSYSNNFAYNYQSKFLFYPIWEPHGSTNAGIMTLSKYKMESAIRRSLPISTNVFKFMDLDRCYAVTRLPVDNGKELILYNVHLSAYTVEDDIVSNQVKMLAEDMLKEIQNGNYIICGGDFNQDMLGISPEIFKTDVLSNSWALPFPKDLLPKNIYLMSDHLSREELFGLAPSCRNADSPYKKGTSFVTFVDGFLLSKNVEMEEFKTIDTEFKYSDHNPIVMKIKLLE